MTDRVIDISQQGAALRVRNAQLVITLSDGQSETMPMDDLGVIVVSHPAVSYSQSVFIELLRQGGAFVVCNERFLPVGMLLPLAANYIQAERIAAQVNATLPVKKQIWRRIVEAKVEAQGALLRRLRGSDSGIAAMSRRVLSGDSTNIEAQAARRYWPLLFDDPSFRREFEAADQNRLLNYGYAVLRAITARGLCAAGLHLSIGVHHHNRYDPFCLADDLMEPMRPIVDRAVAAIVAKQGPEAPLDSAAKTALIGALQERFECNGEVRTLFDIANRLGSVVANTFSGRKSSLHFPKL